MVAHLFNEGISSAFDPWALRGATTRITTEV